MADESVVDDLLDCARYGELDDIASYIDSLGHKPDAPVALLALAGCNGNTMLHMACANGHLRMPHTVILMLALVEYVLRRAPCPMTAVNARNEQGNTPLHWSALNGHLAIVEALVRAGADMSVHNEAGHTAFFDAQSNGHEQIVNYLFQFADFDQDEDDDAASEDDGQDVSDNEQDGIDSVGH